MLSKLVRSSLIAALVLTGTAFPAQASGAAGYRLADEPLTAINDVLFTAKGRLSLSVDGGGSLSSSYTVQVQKPNSSARVRAAFLLAASTGGSNYIIPNGNGGVRLNGTGISWQTFVSGPVQTWNHYSDVTALIKPAVNGAPAGRISFSVSEAIPLLVDGTVLAVVFDDPAQTKDSTVTLLFGAQRTTGDTFSITLAEPIQPSSPDALFNMGLGISFGAQASCANGVQYSQVSINGRRLTSSAGGEDDGSCADGALLTVGGLDDSTNNPSNPNAGPNGNPRADDELYSLLPFITSSTRRIDVATLNPSNDDNIFFAYFQISGDADISTGSCSPSPTTLCLDDRPNDRRFKVEVSFATSQGGGLSGNGQAISLSSLGVRSGGLFWFFSADNPELLVKVLNGCGVNNRYWVFYSAGTNVGFNLKVTDTVTGEIYQSVNPDRRLAPPVADTSAFSCN